MYDEGTAAPVMRELFGAQMRLLDALAQGGSDDDAEAAAVDGTSPLMPARQIGALRTFVEVGCGTSEAGSRMLTHGSVSAYVGVDLSSTFLELSAALHPVLNDQARAALLQGDASKLESLIATAGTGTPTAPAATGFAADAASTASSDGEDEENGEAAVCGSAAAMAATSPCLVGCVMNTMGILPDFIRAATVCEMIRTAKPGGTVVVGCWCADKFAEGVERFYKRHPELCGVIDDSMVDLESATLVNPAGPSGLYTSQWWTHERVKQLFPKAVRHRVRTITASIGVFAILRVAEEDVKVTCA